MRGAMKRLARSLPVVMAVCAVAALSAAQDDAAAVAVKKHAEDCGCEIGPSPEVFAVVDGVRITGDEVTEATQAKVDELRRQVIELRNRELAVQINSRLVGAEAKRRGVTATRLIEEEVIAKVKAPTEAEARAYHDQNKDRISGEFAEAKDAVVNTLVNLRQKDEATKLIERLRAAAEVKVLVQKVTPPKTEEERSRVLATVDGQAITSGDIEDALQPAILRARQQIYALRKGVLDVKINDILLAQAARQRKVTTDALLAAEVTAKVKEVSEQDARAFYEQNKHRIDGEYETLKDQIIQYVQDQERRKTEEAFARKLRRDSSLDVFLEAPETPVYTIATDDQPWRGGPDAPVTIVEFTDFQCPGCAQTQPVLEKLAQEYGDRVKLVVRDFPLSQHTDAFQAAEAAEAARAQGRYWEYTRVLFAQQSALGVERLKEYASKLGLDREEFDRALDGGKYAPQVERDLQDGKNLGVNSTPAVFLNGRRVEERTYDSLKSAIEAALRNAAAETASTKAQRPGPTSGQTAQ